MDNWNRRRFVAGSLASLASAQTQGAAVGTGMIGAGGRGSYLLKTVLDTPGTKVAAVCDIKPDRVDRAATAAGRDKPAAFSDYRRLLERKAAAGLQPASYC